MISQKRYVVVLVLMAAAVMILGARKISSEHERVRLGYELNEARRTLREADEENRRLRLEYSVLVSPSRIRPLATALGMEPIDPTQIRVVDAPGAVRQASAEVP